MKSKIIKEQPHEHTRQQYPFRYRRGTSQRGSLLIGLIVTIVILSALSGSMVYFFGSSVMDPVFGNFAQRAYYAAESGMRFAVAVFRSDMANGRTNFFALNGRTLTFPDNGQAALTIPNTPTILAETTTTAISIGSDRTLAVDNASQFPDNGFFKIEGVTGYFRYNSKSGNTLQLVTGPSVTWLTGAKVTSPADQIAMTIKGSFPLVGMLNMSREVKYAWILSGQSTGVSTDPISPAFDPTKWDIDRTRVIRGETVYFGGPGTSWGGVTYDTQEAAIRVYSTTSTAQARFILGYNTEWAYDEWVRQNNYLSYDTQVKIKTFNKITQLHLGTYLAGLSFRLWGNSANYSTLNASFARGTSGLAPFSLPTSTDPYIIFWSDITQGQNRVLLAYVPLTEAGGIIAPANTPVVLFSESLASTLDPNTNQWVFSFWTPASTTSELWVPYQQDDQQHPDFTRVSSTVLGTQTLTLNNNWTVTRPSYLAFYQRHHFRANGVGSVEISVNNGAWQQVKRYNNSSMSTWTTQYPDTSQMINLSGYISSYPAEVKVRFIMSNTGGDTQQNYWDVDDVSIITIDPVSHLKDWSTILVRVKELSAPSTPSSIFTGRVNEIEVFYGHAGLQGQTQQDSKLGTGGNTDPADNNRWANPRCDAVYDSNGNLLPCTGNWPPNVLSTLQAANDKFKLVSGWTFAALSIPGCRFELAGTGVEQNAIIRTNCYLTTTYPDNTNNEVGIHAYGAEVAGNVYFDDFGISTGGTGGGLGFVTPIQQ